MPAYRPPPKVGDRILYYRYPVILESFVVSLAGNDYWWAIEQNERHERTMVALNERSVT